MSFQVHRVIQKFVCLLWCDSLLWQCSLAAVGGQIAMCTCTRVQLQPRDWFCCPFEMGNLGIGCGFSIRLDWLWMSALWNEVQRLPIFIWTSFILKYFCWKTHLLLSPKEHHKELLRYCLGCSFGACNECCINASWKYKRCYFLSLCLMISLFLEH